LNDFNKWDATGLLEDGGVRFARMLILAFFSVHQPWM